MNYQIKTWLRALPWNHISEIVFLGLIVISILWKGGKTLETTWLLMGIAGCLTLLPWIKRWIGLEQEEEPGLPIRLSIAVFAFIILTALSYLTSETGNYGLDDVLRTAALGLVLIWVVGHAKRDSIVKTCQTRADAILLTIGCAALLLCAIGIAVYILQPVNRFVGTFTDPRFHTDYWPNACAEFLLLAWPIVVIRMRHRLRSMVVPLSLVLGCLLLTYSRGALLAFGLQCVILLGLYARSSLEKGVHWKSYRLPVFRVGLIFIFSLTVFTSVNVLRSRISPVQSVADKVTLSAAEGTSSITERLDFFAQAWSLFLERPLLGWGPYSFRFTQTAMQEGILETSDHAHNVILKLLSERGLLAAVAFVCIILFILIPVVRRVWKNKEVLSTQSLLAVSIIGLLAHNMIDYNLQFVGIALVLWVLLGLLVVESDQSLNKNNKSVQHGALVVAIMFLLVACYEGVFLTTSSVARHAESAGDLDKALVWYQRSLPGMFSRDLHLSRAGILSGREQYGPALEAVDAYLEINDRDYRAWKRRGEILMRQEEFGPALGALEEAYRRGRYNDLGITRLLSETLFLAYGKEVLETRMDEFGRIFVDFAQAIERNVHYIALSTNVEELIAYTEFMIPLYKDRAPLYEVYGAKADHNAQMERARTKARPPGFLW